MDASTTGTVRRTAVRDLSDAEFVALRDYLRVETGLVFDDARRPALAGIVADRLPSSGRRSLVDYLDLVGSADGRAERQRLIDAATVPETQFFRNGPQMEALRRRILPELMRRAVVHRRPCTIWSAGCSTGEEAYSLAMLTLEVAAGMAAVPPVRILATDVSASALEAAEQATYAGRSMDLVGPERKAKWFSPTASAYKVVRRVGDLVEVRQHNLVTDPMPFADGQVDLVLCRNVTIYFARDTTRVLADRFHDVLNDGGYLMLGHAETLWQLNDAFALVPLADAFVYRKDPRVPALRAAARRAGNQPPVRILGAYGLLPGAADATPPPGLARTATPQRLPVRPPAPAPAARGAARRVETPSSVLAAGRVAYDAARFAEAARLGDRAARMDPDLVAAYVLAGRARATLGDDRTAVITLRKAVYLNPTAGDAYVLLAGALARLGSLAGAARAYRSAALTLRECREDDLVELLDGCGVDDLVALCDRLADECEVRSAAREGLHQLARRPQGPARQT